MSNHFYMGAINKITNNYEYPRIATKQNKYKCPCCEKDVIFKHGKIKQRHFSHYKSTNNPCYYYEKPIESQIHKDAKLMIKTLLDNKTTINIIKNCNYCEQRNCGYIENVYYDINECYNENTKAVMEYRFDYNNSKKSADVALIENDKIIYIFEICYKNKTKEENRPEPWFEINAETLINETNSGENINDIGEIEIECVRDYKCSCCKDQEEYEIKRQIDILENMKIREKEQYLVKNELLNMSNEDERTIQINHFEKEQKRIKSETEYKEREKEREKERTKIEKDKKEIEEKQFRINEYYNKLLELNKVCSICNINYCKCLTSNCVKDEYNIIKCDSCNKQPCKCIRITDFFKNKRK